MTRKELLMENNPTPLQKLQEHIQGLAPVVQWLKQHPALDNATPVIQGNGRIGFYVDSGDGFADAVRALKDGAPIGTVHRNDDDGFTRFERSFGGVTAYVYTSRSSVCEKVVVGTETVEIPDPDAPMVTVEREVVRWECRPVLADRDAEAVQV